MSIAYTGMNKSSRHKGYYTQNIKCLRIRAKHNMKKEGDRVMSKLLRRSGSQLASQKTTHVYSAVHSHARRGPERISPLYKNLNAFSKCCWIGSQPAKSSTSSETSFSPSLETAQTTVSSMVKE